MKALDPEAVQAFVLVADLKSFTRAAEALDTTQSAVSLKIKRLEQVLGRRLLERTPRVVRISADGNAFIDHARTLVAAHERAVGCFEVKQTHRLIVGISPHVVGAELPLLLRRVGNTQPGLVFELRVATSQDLLDDFHRSDLDAVIVLKTDTRGRGGEVIIKEQFAWIAAPDFEHRPGEALRLATQAEPCSVRSMAVAALDAARIPWTEVFVGGGTATIGAAISAGLAVAALGRRTAPPGTIDIGPQLGLPQLPARDVVLHSNVSDRQSRASLRTLVAAIRSTAA